MAINKFYSILTKIGKALESVSLSKELETDFDRKV